MDTDYGYATLRLCYSSNVACDLACNSAGACVRLLTSPFRHRISSVLSPNCVSIYARMAEREAHCNTHNLQGEKEDVTGKIIGQADKPVQT
eukprot:1145139-Pelagomonas_calceolata.AAC.2